MTEKQMLTLVKAGYVMVAAAGQSQSNLNILGMVILYYFPNITESQINAGKNMRMKEMVTNLEQFGKHNLMDACNATEIVYGIYRELQNEKALKLGIEIREILETAEYKEKEMPELKIRLNISRFIFN